MSVWEYKVITSGKGGFATPALLETFLNQLGKEEWEILHFQSQPDNALAFTGLARRPTQRDWTLEDAVAAAARVEADKLRVEFAAKFKEGSGSATEEKPEASAAEKADADDGYRKIRDTDRDLDPDSPEESAEAGDWEKLAAEDELPTFFEALRPHLRRNQRGAGLSVGVDYLAKKWQLSEADVLGALKECGLAVPEDEDSDPTYVEYDGDLFWVNVNRRGELWINTKEKPRAVFRTVPGKRVEAEEAGEGAAPRREGGHRREETPRAEPAAEAPAPGQSQPRAPRAPEPGRPLPTGTELLEKIGPMMRRSRRGSGVSGSVSFLSRALKCSEADLVAGFGALGLTVPTDGNPEQPPIEIGEHIWWLNHDQRGGVWINGDHKGAAPAPASAATPAGDYVQPTATPPDAPTTEAGPVDLAPPAPSHEGAGAPLAAVRLLLTPTKTGGFSAEVGRLAETLGKTADDLLATLTGTGLKIPEKAKEKPVFVEHGGEIFWLNKSAKDDLWLNAKASKYADASAEKRPSRPRGRKSAAREA